MFAVLVRFTDKFGAARYKTYGPYGTEEEGSDALMALDSLLSAYIQVDSLEVAPLELFVAPPVPEKLPVQTVPKVTNPVPVVIQQPIVVQPYPYYQPYPLRWDSVQVTWNWNDGVRRV